MVLQEYTDFSLQKGGAPADNGHFAHFRLRPEISHLFPYINAIADSAGFFPKLPFIRFVLDGFCCGLHPDQGVCASFADRQQALDFMERLLDFLHEVSRDRDRLDPNYRAWKPVPALHIYKLLPRTNCGDCGFTSCLAFAAAVSRRQTGPEGCPGFHRPLMTQAVYPVIDKQGTMVSTVTLDIDPNTCNHSPMPNQPSGWSASVPRKSTHAADGIVPLSGREKEVLRLVAQGATNPEIAARLKLSAHTVKSHVISIFNKLSVNDRTQAAVWAVRQHLV